MIPKPVPKCPAGIPMVLGYCTLALALYALYGVCDVLLPTAPRFSDAGFAP